MRSYKSRLIRCSALVAVLGLGGCATPTIQVQSSPDQADVSLVTDQGRSPLGKTPMAVNADAQPALFSSGGLLEIRKDGFFPEIIIVPGSGMGKSTNVGVKLSELKAAETCSHTAASNLARGVAAAQQQILSKRFVEAEATLNALIGAYPNVSVLYDLIGNLHYLRRDTNRSLDAYRRSFELEPGNTYTERMIRKLSSIDPGENTGGRR